MRKMDAEEFRNAKATLGFKTQFAYGEAFDIPLRTVVRYLAGDPIPSQVAMLIRIAIAYRRNLKKLLTIGHGGK